MKWTGRGAGSAKDIPPGSLVSIAIDLPRTDEPRPSLVADHLAPYFGCHDATLRGVERDGMRVDTNLVWPTSKRPWLTAYTVGMSARPMNVPSELRERHSPWAELFLRLPPDWVPEEVCPFCDPPRVERASPLADRRRRWPFEWLVRVARHPHENGTFVGQGHLFSYDDLAPICERLPFAGSLFDAGFDEAGDRPIPPLVRGDGARVEFLGVTMLHAAELRAIGAGRGSDVMRALDAAKVTELLDPARPSCV